VEDLSKKIEILKQFNDDLSILLILRDAKSSEELNEPLSSIIKN
jgi:hypothetical protein